MFCFNNSNNITYYSGNGNIWWLCYTIIKANSKCIKLNRYHHYIYIYTTDPLQYIILFYYYLYHHIIILGIPHSARLVYHYKSYKKGTIRNCYGEGGDLDLKGRVKWYFLKI